MSHVYTFTITPIQKKRYHGAIAKSSLAKYLLTRDGERSAKRDSENRPSIAGIPQFVFYFWSKKKMENDPLVPEYHVLPRKSRGKWFNDLAFTRNRRGLIEKRKWTRRAQGDKSPPTRTFDAASLIAISRSRPSPNKEVAPVLLAADALALRYMHLHASLAQTIPRRQFCDDFYDLRLDDATYPSSQIIFNGFTPVTSLRRTIYRDWLVLMPDRWWRLQIRLELPITAVVLEI